jgi:MinD-like ATPase involved in chromosome partitioning or flagellar assembly
MSVERYVVLGLAHTRSPWFRELGRWANDGTMPIDFVKCLSPEEVRARLETGRRISALLADASAAAADRDLVDRARRGATVIVVDDGRVTRDWAALGVTAALRHDFTRSELLDCLVQHAVPIGRIEHQTLDAPPPPDTPWRGHVVAVTGPGGAGSSTVAMAVAQALGGDARHRGLVVLADLSLDADLAMLHDARDVVPGLQELTDACRGGMPLDEVADLVFRVADRGYDLLLGLRRHCDWTAIRPRAFDLALDTLRRRYRVVVADVDPDVEGEDETGSVDVAERNHIARATLLSADLVLIVGRPGVKGLHSLARTVHQLRTAGVDTLRCLPVVNCAGRSPRQRAELSRAFAELAGDEVPLAGPVFLPERRQLHLTVSRAAPLPKALCRPVGSLVSSALEKIPRARPTDAEPAAVAPGSLGSWTPDSQVSP